MSLKKTVLVNLSNRHMHLSRADVEALFGPGYQLCKTKDLVQPGQFACEEGVSVVGPKGRFDSVRILGPERPETQVEIMASDAFRLGIKDVPCRESGKIDGTPGFTLEGPYGKVVKDKGLIVAMRHVHLDPATAARLGLVDKQLVKLRVGAERAATFENVLLRVSDKFAAEAHLDFDEGNAVGIGNGAEGEIIVD
jgi:putative phosphotransacetylase